MAGRKNRLASEILESYDLLPHWLQGTNLLFFDAVIEEYILEAQKPSKDRSTKSRVGATVKGQSARGLFERWEKRQ